MKSKFLHRTAAVLCGITLLAAGSAYAQVTYPSDLLAPEHSGKFYDASSGAYYNYYDPATGRYSNQLPGANVTAVNTGGSAPGVPNTGAGGDGAANLFMLAASGIAAAAATVYAVRRRASLMH